MRIATWNVERLKHYKDIDVIFTEIDRCRADVLLLSFPVRLEGLIHRGHVLFGIG